MNMSDHKAKVLTGENVLLNIKQSTINQTTNTFRAAFMITNKHRTYVQRPTDGGGSPVGVIYITDEEELPDSERSAHERPLSGT